MNKKLHVWALAALAAATGPARAADGFTAPAASGGSDWIAVAVAVLAAAAIVILGFKNAKRTHLD